MSGSWLWVDIPLCVLIFLAVCGIPLWMVFKHPDHGPHRAGQASEAQQDALAWAHEMQAQQVPVVVERELITAGADHRSY